MTHTSFFPPVIYNVILRQFRSCKPAFKPISTDLPTPNPLILDGTLMTSLILILISHISGAGLRLDLNLFSETGLTNTASDVLFAWH